MKMETLNAPVADVPFKDLFVSEINPRAVVDEDGIAALAENIKALGLIQNLAGIRTVLGIKREPSTRTTPPRRRNQRIWQPACRGC